MLGFEFDDFEQAWTVLASVTATDLDVEQEQTAKQAVQLAMWPDPQSQRIFNNLTQFIVGRRE